MLTLVAGGPWITFGGSSMAKVAMSEGACLHELHCASLLVKVS